jgi:hypothetical protein
MHRSLPSYFSHYSIMLDNNEGSLRNLTISTLKNVESAKVVSI